MTIWSTPQSLAEAACLSGERWACLSGDRGINENINQQAVEWSWNGSSRTCCKGGWSWRCWRTWDTDKASWSLPEMEKWAKRRFSWGWMWSCFPGDCLTQTEFETKILFWISKQFHFLLWPLLSLFELLLSWPTSFICCRLKFLKCPWLTVSVGGKEEFKSRIEFPETQWLDD